MANATPSHLGVGGYLSLTGAGGNEGRHPSQHLHWVFGLLVAVVLWGALAFGQGAPRVTSVAPAAGKVNDNLTINGENLGKSTVAAALLSDDKTDYKATIVDQAADKIVIKVPQVKAGDYNVSIQVGNNIFIQPIRFKVQE